MGRPVEECSLLATGKLVVGIELALVADIEAAGMHVEVEVEVEAMNMDMVPLRASRPAEDTPAAGVVG